jgi:hypothetical protein
MRRFLAVLLLWIATASPAYCAPQDATVRITSHGCSGCVIWTGKGRSLVLTCAHAFQGSDYRKRIAIDAPAPRAGAVVTGGIRVLRCNYDLDLVLIEMGYRSTTSAPSLPPATDPREPGHVVTTRCDRR